MDDEADTGSAERAFDALRAEVVALRQAVEGQTAPDYALTLGAIVKELQAAGARLDAIEAAPPMQVTPATIAQQIRDEAVRLADSQARQMQAAREGFERGQDTLGRVAFFQQRADRDRNILWAVGRSGADRGRAGHDTVHGDQPARAGRLGVVGGLGGLADAGGPGASRLSAHRPKQPWSRHGGERGYPAGQRLRRRTAQVRGRGDADGKGAAVRTLSDPTAGALTERLRGDSTSGA